MLKTALKLIKKIEEVLDLRAMTQFVKVVVEKKKMTSSGEMMNNGGGMINPAFLISKKKFCFVF